jgi:hypothetical protein
MATKNSSNGILFGIINIRFNYFVSKLSIGGFMEGGLLLLYMLLVGLTWLSYGLIIAAFFVNISDRNNTRIKTTKFLLGAAFVTIALIFSVGSVLNNLLLRDILIPVLLLIGIAISWFWANRKISYTLVFVGMLLLIIDNSFFATALINWRERDSQILLSLSQKYLTIEDFFAKINNLRVLVPEIQFHSWSMYYFYITVIILFALAIISSFAKQHRGWLLSLLIIPAMFFAVIYRDNLVVNKYIKDIEATDLSNISDIQQSKLAVHAIKFDETFSSSFKLSILDPKNDKVIDPPMADKEEIVSTALSPDGEKAAYISFLMDEAGAKSYQVKYFNIQTNQVKAIAEINGYTYNFDVDWKNNLVAIGSQINNSENNVTVYDFNGSTVSTEEGPTKLFFFGDNKLYLIQGQTPEFSINEKDLANGRKTKVATLSGGGFNQDLSYKIYPSDPNKAYITLNDKDYIFDIKDSKLLTDVGQNSNGWVTHKGGINNWDATTSVDFSPNKKNYLIRLNSNENYERIYFKSEQNNLFYRFPYGATYDERFLGALWLDDQHFIGQSFKSYFVGNIRGKMAPLESTKIWSSNTQADAQLPYRHGRNWTEDQN